MRESKLKSEISRRKKVNKFSVVDVIAVLTESSVAKRYWTDLKRRLKAEGADEVYAKIVQLKMPAADGKKYTATIYADAKDAHYKTSPQAYTVSTKTVTSKTKLKIYTASASGCAIKIEEIVQ